MKTLVIIKPDGVQKNLIGKIIQRYEEAGLRVVALKMLKPSMDLAKMHYPDSMAPIIGEKSVKAGEKVKDVKEQGMKVLGWLRNFITSSSVVAMILEGEDAVKNVRKISGYTDPSTADVGTIRRDYGTDSILKANAEGRPVYNLLHASGTPEEAEHEIKLWFPEI